MSLRQARSSNKKKTIPPCHDKWTNYWFDKQAVEMVVFLKIFALLWTVNESHCRFDVEGRMPSVPSVCQSFLGAKHKLNDMFQICRQEQIKCDSTNRNRSKRRCFLEGGSLISTVQNHRMNSAFEKQSPISIHLQLCNVSKHYCFCAQSLKVSHISRQHAFVLKKNNDFPCFHLTVMFYLAYFMLHAFVLQFHTKILINTILSICMLFQWNPVVTKAEVKQLLPWSSFNLAGQITVFYAVYLFQLSISPEILKRQICSGNWWPVFVHTMQQKCRQLVNKLSLLTSKLTTIISYCSETSEKNPVIELVSHFVWLTDYIFVTYSRLEYGCCTI